MKFNITTSDDGKLNIVDAETGKAIEFWQRAVFTAGPDMDYRPHLELQIPFTGIENINTTAVEGVLTAVVGQTLYQLTPVAGAEKTKEVRPWPKHRERIQQSNRIDQRLLVHLIEIETEVSRLVESNRPTPISDHDYKPPAHHTVYCVFCGKQYPPGTTQNQLLVEHIISCPKHPLGKELREKTELVENLKGSVIELEDKQAKILQQHHDLITKTYEDLLSLLPAVSGPTRSKISEVGQRLTQAAMLLSTNPVITAPSPEDPGPSSEEG